MPAAALPCVVVGAAALCEQVPNGRSINYNCTACQPTLGKKPIKDWEKPLTLWKKQSTWISCHADRWKEHRAARWMAKGQDALKEDSLVNAGHFKADEQVCSTILFY